MKRVSLLTVVLKATQVKLKGPNDLLNIGYPWHSKINILGTLDTRNACAKVPVVSKGQKFMIKVNGQVSEATRGVK